MILPYEIMNEIAMCNYRAYKAIITADKRLHELLRSVNKLAHFSAKVDDIGRHDDYYLCFRHVVKDPTKAGERPEVRVLIDGVDKTINYTEFINASEHGHTTMLNEVKRSIKVGTTTYVETISYLNNKIHSLQHTVYEMGRKTMSEKWYLYSKLHTIETYTILNLKKHKMQNYLFTARPQWAILHHKFIYV